MMNPQKENNPQERFAKVVYVPGKGGLYEVVSITRRGALLRHLETGTPLFLPPHHPLSFLQEMGIYVRDSDPIPLADIFRTLHEKVERKELALPDNPREVQAEELYQWLGQIVPNYDPERVRPVDIQKVIRWYQMLRSVNALPSPKSPKQEESGREETEDPGKHGSESS